MLHFVDGDIFDRKVDLMVNPVNTVGVMGKGLALEFKKRYPSMFDYYQERCGTGMLFVGIPIVFYSDEQKILLFPTKENWWQPSRIDWVESGLIWLRGWLRKFALQEGINSISIPKLGCGCGGLNWEDVKELIVKYLNDVPSEIYVYE